MPDWTPHAMRGRHGTGDRGPAVGLAVRRAGVAQPQLRCRPDDLGGDVALGARRLGAPRRRACRGPRPGDRGHRTPRCPTTRRRSGSPSRTARRCRTCRCRGSSTRTSRAPTRAGRASCSGAMSGRSPTSTTPRTSSRGWCARACSCATRWSATSSRVSSRWSAPARSSAGWPPRPGSPRARSGRSSAPGEAAILLGDGLAALDVVHRLGYYDQPHLARSLSRFVGRTATQLRRPEAPEPLSLLYKTGP